MISLKPTYLSQWFISFLNSFTRIVYILFLWILSHSHDFPVQSSYRLLFLSMIICVNNHSIEKSNYLITQHPVKHSREYFQGHHFEHRTSSSSSRGQLTFLPVEEEVNCPSSSGAGSLRANWTTRHRKWVGGLLSPIFFFLYYLFNLYSFAIQYQTSREFLGLWILWYK